MNLLPVVVLIPVGAIASLLPLDQARERHELTAGGISEIPGAFAEAREESKLAEPSLIRLHHRLGWALTDFDPGVSDCMGVSIAVHLAPDSLWLGLNVGDRRQVMRKQDAYDWPAVAEILAEYKALPAFEDYESIEISTAPTVRARSLAKAIKLADAAGFRDAVIVDRAWSSVELDEVDDLFPMRTLGRHSIGLVLTDEGVVVANDDNQMVLIERRGRRDNRRAIRETIEDYIAGAPQLKPRTAGFITSVAWRGSGNLERYFKLETLLADLGVMRLSHDWAKPHRVIGEATDRGLVPRR